MTETPDLVRRLFDHVTTSGTLTEADWLAFKQQNKMTAEQREAVLLATLRHVLVLATEQQSEMDRLSVALARRG